MSNKKFKALSHIERMFDNSHRVCAKFPLHVDQRTEIYTELDEKTKRVVKKLRLKTAKLDKMKDYKVSDFSIENLSAIGAIGTLNDTQYTHSYHSTIDGITSAAENIVNNSKN